MTPTQYDGKGDTGYRFYLSQASCGWNVSVHAPSGTQWWTRYRATRKAAMNDAVRASGGSTIEWTPREA